MTICVSRPQADSFTGHAKNVTFLQLTDLITDTNAIVQENQEELKNKFLCKNKGLCYCSKIVSDVRPLRRRELFSIKCGYIFVTVI